MGPNYVPHFGTNIYNTFVTNYYAARLNSYPPSSRTEGSFGPTHARTPTHSCTTTRLPPPTRQAGALVIFVYVVGAIRAKLPVLENEVTQEILDIYLAKWDEGNSKDAQGIKM